MPKEVERRFLVKYVPQEVFKVKDRLFIKEGYIPIEDPFRTEVRLRETECCHYLAVKRDGSCPTVRDEVEVQINIDAFKELWTLIGGLVEKVRYYIPHCMHFDGNNIFLKLELSFFLEPKDGEPLVEVEFPPVRSVQNNSIVHDALTVAKAFQKPEWFGDEVTDDLSYRSRNIALTYRSRNIALKRTEDIHDTRLIFYRGNKETVLKQLICNHLWDGPYEGESHECFQCTKCHVLKKLYE